MSNARTVTGTRDATGSQAWVNPDHPVSVVRVVVPDPTLLSAAATLSKLPLALVSRNTVPVNVVAGTSRSSNWATVSLASCVGDIPACPSTRRGFLIFVRFGLFGIDVVIVNLILVAWCVVAGAP